MGVLSGLFERYEFQAHFFGSLVKVPQHSLAIAFFVIVLALVGVLLALGQHRIASVARMKCNEIRGTEPPSISLCAIVAAKSILYAVFSRRRLVERE